MSGKKHKKENTLLRNSHIAAITLKSANKLFAEYGSWFWQSARCATIQRANFESRTC
jgi:hypothetical protein